MFYVVWYRTEQAEQDFDIYHMVRRRSLCIIFYGTSLSLVFDFSPKIIAYPRKMRVFYPFPRLVDLYS